jgi:hypothetical protein
VRSVLETTDPDEPDHARVYSRLAERDQQAGFEATQRFYEIGTTDALRETERLIAGG